ncbi:MAG: prolipoprotein diacylglyceryl transferase [Anaerolineaceae bacterium]|nr:prolipoprotein diacylglyceryl transferase [Anaerolineaceae bacterium]
MIDGFAIGPLYIHFYGILVMLGALVAAWLSAVEAKRRKLDSEFIWDMLPWLLIAGIIGARIWHILLPPASMIAQGITTGYYLSHPLDAIAIWKGGLGIPGAVIGGLVALALYTHNHKQSMLTWMDIIAPGLVLAQAIGRWGNFFNQELYGAPSNLPWAIYIDPQHRLPGFENFSRYQPLFLYEFIWNIANATFLLWLGRRYADRLKSGDLFALYVLIYASGRFALEFLRLDKATIGTIDANQTVMAVLAVGSAAFLIWHHFINAKQPAEGTLNESGSGL